MSEQQYDNSNQIALWNPKDERRKGYYPGYGDFNGTKVYDAVMIVSEREGKGPFANLWWRVEGDVDGSARCTAIWKNDDGKLSGKIEGWWVNVYKNDGNGPPLRVKFKAMEAVAAAAPSAPADDEIPF
ncbi:hypothetical protein N9878_02215 [bacterium]|nr:hypothetical protein [bacterium]